MVSAPTASLRLKACRLSSKQALGGSDFAGDGEPEASLTHSQPPIPGSIALSRGPGSALSLASVPRVREKLCVPSISV